MRNFTNSADFDDTLPEGDGLVQASFRLTPERFAEGLGAWLTQRGKGEGCGAGGSFTDLADCAWRRSGLGRLFGGNSFAFEGGADRR